MQASIHLGLAFAVGATDQFADRSPGFYLNSVSTYAVVPGAIITAVGVLSNV